ncbi:MAG: ATP-dependent DNA helicase [bacterium]|nr:ATP-dependent DNA helicase [bacterium]
MAEIYFRHDSLRKQQEHLIADAYTAIENKEHLLAHAVTGTGKTDALISPAISYALENNKTVFFLTPKISQHRIAMDVVRSLAKKYELDLRAVDFIGRKYACVDPALSEQDAEGFYQSCERKRKKEQCEFYRNSKGFSRLEEARADRLFKSMEKRYGCGMHHTELVEIGKENQACPYEWLTKLASTSNVIVADYFHLMLPQIRDIFLLKTKKKLSNSIIIVDEAHNLAKRVRDQLSVSTNTFLQKKLDKELRALGLKSNFENKFNRWAKHELGKAREKLVSKDEYFNALSNEEYTPEDLADYLESCGQAFMEATGKKSFCLRFSRFLQLWIDENKIPSVRILRRKGEAYFLSRKALDPSSATSKMNDAHSAILTSGTLLPLEMHRDVLGLDQERTNMKQYASPFSKKNKLNMVLEGFTTRYSQRRPEQYKKMGGMLDKIIKSTPGGTALFFPSYKVMGAVTPFMESRNLILQRERMSPTEIGELLKEFQERGTLCCVQGGSLSEGIDYNQEEIKTAVIVGIALDEMSLEVESLIDHYDEKFGQGWNYGYLYPGVTKAIQSAGRAIRKETDRAVLIYMDERFKWKNYSSMLPKDERFVLTADPLPYMDKFWE